MIHDAPPSTVTAIVSASRPPYTTFSSCGSASRLASGKDAPANGPPGVPRGQTAAAVQSTPPVVEYQTVGAVSSSGSTPAATIRPPLAVNVTAWIARPASPA